MTVPVSKVNFVNKAQVFRPKYYKDDLTKLQNKGAVNMIQLPGIYADDPKEASKIVVGIDSNGKIMNGTKDIAVLPCPNHCDPPGSGGLVTLSSFLA